MNLQTITLSWIALALVTHVLLYFVKAPFGRHTSDKWGLTINNKLGWFIMELPSLLIMVCFLVWGTYSTQSFVWILFLLWIIHYVNRTFIYSLRIKPTDKKMPVLIVCSAVFFNLMNAGLNGCFLAELASPESYDAAWLTSPHFMAGLFLFLLGMGINIVSDNTLIHLRKPGETGYKIPQGFLFKYVSSPNLFGEVIEWTGFAIMAWNLPALSFAVWTFANLVPRALNHHQWYKDRFPEYPKDRKAIFPFVL
jgi:3-oxo-5-alpha-steroid 4-dehydrogenase 1